MDTATVRHHVAPAALLVAVLFAAMGCSSSAATTSAAGQGANTKAVGAPSSGATGGGASSSGAVGDGASSSGGDDATTSAGGDDTTTSASAGDGATTSSAAGGGVGNGSFPNACSLITQDQASAALGAPVKPGGLVPLSGGGGTCTYGATDDTPSDVVVQIAGSDVMKQVLDGHKTQPVADLGDEALLYGMGGDIYNIYVRKGSTTIDINIATKGGKFSHPEALPPQPVADALTTLAKTALGRI